MRSTRSPLRDPVVRGLLVFWCAGGLLLLGLDGDQVRLGQVFWMFQVPLDAAFGLLAWRAGQASAARFRRFWRVLAFSGLAYTIGDTYQSVCAWIVPGSASLTGNAVQTGCFAVGMSATVIACLLFPQGRRTRREQLVYWLDATTVLICSAVLAWCFGVAGADDVVTTSVSVSLVLLAAFASTRVALAAHPPMTRAAAWTMIGAALIQGAGSFLPVGADGVADGYVWAVRLLPSLLVALGPRVQELQIPIHAARAQRKRKPYSILPYFVVVLILAAFFRLLATDQSVRLWVAAIGLAAITVLVAARQLVAFHENASLIRRLDGALAELRVQEARLWEQASYDGLTRLANRSHFGELLDDALAAPGPPPMLMLIDLDDFKTVNDTLGHAAGDVLLTTVAERLREMTRGSDVVARLGGDEFAVLLPGTTPAEADALARRVIDRLADPVEIEQHPIATKASIGLAVSEPGAPAALLLRNADIAMYEAKDRGKGTVVLYSADMGTRIGRDAELAQDLRRAVRAGEFVVEYQPVVLIDTGRVTGVEALVRWQHPVRGRVSPGEFIPMAERTGLIVPIGLWVLREACRQAASWQRQYPAAAELTVNVNVAAEQLRTPSFPADVAGALADAGLAPRSLTVEVTETVVVDDDESIAALHRLRAMGVSIALDDFGTAASSLSLLLTCPVSTLKLDRSFVEQVTTATRQAAVATAVSQIAEVLQLGLVAEGVETPEQAELLWSLGYRHAQGFLYSRPVPAEAAAAWWLPDRVEERPGLRAGHA
ncbi:EAL domain-containing protein [Actinoplanes sp. NPDC051470]|uniref:putative bifunctional diguanylate cyclase/phosphodiesterase n=1 Tax=Actinoplanes sp. NPDC051470 TaxID=3157224 RepID=UPI00342856FD